MKANALIRSNFNIDPEQLQQTKWAELYAQALWLEQYRLQNQAEMLVKLLGNS